MHMVYYLKKDYCETFVIFQRKLLKRLMLVIFAQKHRLTDMMNSVLTGRCWQFDVDCEFLMKTYID